MGSAVGEEPPPSSPVLPGDNPIRRAKDDVLGRAPLAQAFAQQIILLDSSEGVVVGVLGPWGSGKTSFVNLARIALESERIAVVDFNPWMFSGTEQLIEVFFRELSAQLRLDPVLSDVGDRLAEYGEAVAGMGWLPLVGPWIERTRATAKILETALRRRKEGVGKRRDELTVALKRLHKPIVVVLDDIDRLSTSEIRHVFQLVRLTASFPSLIYVVAFDRERVEQALGESGVPGRDYLEKILQVAVDLPPIPIRLLSRQVFESIDSAINAVGTAGQFDENLWPDVFSEVIKPLLRNMRDVRRYATSVHGALRNLGSQIALVDLLAMEAVRTFLPDVFAALHSSVAGLTTAAGNAGWARDEPPHLKAQVNALVTSGGDHAEVVRCMVRRLFPAGERHLGGTSYGSDWAYRWLKERRVAHEDVLRLYLERSMGESLQAFTLAERARELLADEAGLNGFFGSIEPSLWEDVIAALEAFEEEFAPEHVVPGTTVLLNLLPNIPDRPRGMFEFGPKMVVGRVTFRLLRSLGDPDLILQAVEQIYPEVTTLSSKLELITDVGHRENAGHKLVSETAAADLEARWREDVRGAGAYLNSEWDLLRVLYLAMTETREDEETLRIPDSPHVTLTILRSARSDVKSQSAGSRAVRRSPRLAWDVLLEVFGDEAELKRRIDALRDSGLDDSSDLVELADKYLSGWRPERF
jgi:hypothetical protein